MMFSRHLCPSRTVFGTALMLIAAVAQAQPVWINEVLTNPNGSDSTATYGNEYFELRGTPNLSLAGYYLLSIEGGGTTTRGDINQFFDLGAFSLGANGYLFCRQNFSPYTNTAPGAAVVENTSGQGWGLTGASTAGHSGDGTQVDLENGTTTLLLIHIGAGPAPTLTMDLDADDDGLLDALPAGWTIVDSVGIIDGVATGASTDFSYGAVTLRVQGAAAGSSRYGNIVEVPGAPPTTAGAMYVGRKGERTGSTAADWFGAILVGSSSDAPNITFDSASDAAYQGLRLTNMVFGGANPAFVSPPDALQLLSPGNDQLNVTNSPLLQVSASDPANLGLDVTFYGGAVPAGPDFTVVVLPDSQYYTANARRGLPAMFTSQIDWIIANRLAWNIAFVAHVGDIVDTGDTLSQWQNATNALYRLENPVLTGLAEGIPYGLAVGNHDQEPNGDPTGASTAFFNRYFGTNHFAGKSYYGGWYGTNNDNSFCLFSGGGLDFITVQLEYDEAANSAVLAWANSLLQTYAQRRAIVVSHYIGKPGTPAALGSQGSAIYSALKANTNLFLMLCGHVNGEGSRTDVYNGNTVRTLVSDYQFRGAGGNGLLRLLRFSPARNTVRVFSYSPYAKQYETDADSQFEFAYAMSAGAAAFAPLATNHVASGGVASCVWPGLSPGATYQWYVNISNGSQSTNGPVWRFATTALNPPWTNLAPILNDFYPATITVNSSLTVPFTVDDPDTNPTNLTVSVASTHPTLLPPAGVLKGGAGTNRYIQLTPAAGQAGATLVTVSVSDGQYAPSQSFLLKVLRPEILALWDFNSNPSDNDTTTGTLQPALGSGVAANVGTATASLNTDVTATSYDPNLDDNSKWRLATFPAQSTGNKTSGAEFRVSTVGCRNIAFTWDQYNSATGNRYWRVQYTLDGLNFVDSSFVYTNPAETYWFPTGTSLAGIAGANDNPNFGIRLVSEFENTATGTGTGRYVGAQSSGSYGTSGTLWLDMVTISADIIPPVVALQPVGNFLQLSWPTNRWSFTVQARTNLATGVWETQAAVPMIVNGRNVVTLMNEAVPRYFRLVH